MTLPILVYASAGSGGSMLIWIIKKILYPDYHCSNPIGPDGSAHNQPLCPHWFGNEQEFINIRLNTPIREQIVHCDTNTITAQKANKYFNFIINLENDLDIKHASIFCKNKIPFYKDKPIDMIMDIISSQKIDHELYNFNCGISFQALFNLNIESLIEHIAESLGVDKIPNQEGISSVIAEWRKINNQILQNNKALDKNL